MGADALSEPLSLSGSGGGGGAGSGPMASGFGVGTCGVGAAAAARVAGGLSSASLVAWSVPASLGAVPGDAGD
jgi:hypothetical protein